MAVDKGSLEHTLPYIALEELIVSDPAIPFLGLPRLLSLLDKLSHGLELRVRIVRKGKSQSFHSSRLLRRAEFQFPVMGKNAMQKFRAKRGRKIGNQGNFLGNSLSSFIFPIS